MKKTKVLALLLAVAMIICCLPMNAFATKVPGKTVSSLTYDVNNDTLTVVLDVPANLTLTGADGIEKVDVEEALTKNSKQKKDIKHVQIGEGIAYIGEEAFVDFENLEDVTYGIALHLKHQVLSIKDKAFKGDANLKSFKFLDETGVINYIGEEAFANCTRLEEIVVPDFRTQGYLPDAGYVAVSADKDRTIGKRAFYECYCLETAKIGKNVKKIGEEVFARCLNLEKVVIESAENGYGKGILNQTERLVHMELPRIERFSYIFNQADDTKNFISDKLKYVKFTGGETLYFDEFDDWGDSAKSTIEELYLPATMKAVEYGYVGTAYAPQTTIVLTDVNGRQDMDFSIAINGMTALKTLVVDSANTVYQSIDNCITKSEVDHNYLIAGCKNSKIPAAITDVAPAAFRNMNINGKITLQNGVKTIGAYAFDNAADGVVLPISCRTIWQGAFNGVKVNYLGSEKMARANIVLHGATGDWDYNYAASTTVTPFTDVVADAWYADAANYVKAAEIFKGYEDGKFGPSDSIKRQDFVLSLARYVLGDELDYYNPSAAVAFTDVKSTDYYAKAIAWGVENGIVKGYENGKFGVNDCITREQILTFIYRYAIKVGSAPSNYKTTENNLNYYRLVYTDFDTVSDFATCAVMWSVDNGIISGNSASTIAPVSSASRAEVAQIYFNLKVKAAIAVYS